MVLVEDGGDVVDAGVVDSVVVAGAATTVAGAFVGSGAIAAGSTAAAWLHAEASRQPPISQVVRGVRTTHTLQIPAGRLPSFRGCSPLCVATTSSDSPRSAP